MQLMRNARKRTLILLFAILLGSLCPAFGWAASSRPADSAAIQWKMQQLINFLDSATYKNMVTWEEHIVLVYKLTKGRNPSPLEFYVLNAYHDDISLQRSAALSIVLRGKARHPSWSQCRDFLQKVRFSDFRADREVAAQSQQLRQIPAPEILSRLKQRVDALKPSPSAGLPGAKSAEPDVHYNVYFGYLHAHSELSDGAGSPSRAYQTARASGLDFFALTDHGELLIIWPWENKWEQLVTAAEQYYQSGSYVTLWGFEWSNPLLGHVNVINTTDFTETFSDFWLTDLYAWIIDRPAAFALFNHPGHYDFLSLELFHLNLYPDVVPQMVGIELWNGSESFDSFYYDGNWYDFLDFLSYWDLGNWLGWHLGAQGGQDNHATDWGAQNDFRTAVLATSLTREAIIDAYRNRRFYATEDKDLFLDLRCQGFPMGSRLSGGPREFEVTARDESGDTFSGVRLYRSGIPWQSVAVSGNLIQVTLTDPLPFGDAYYYVIVTQADDNDDNGRNDEAISSPIWIE
ncbi:MAG: CehA/McbA family metallohydrolase [Desulfobacterales bacterium]|jgi:hypothetical protein